MQKKSFWYRNSLSLIIFFFFAVFLFGQSLAGWKQYNEEIGDKHGWRIGYTEYLQSAHFVEATFENWESEFLQMGMYVIFTLFMRQKGSSESKSLDAAEEVDRVPVPHAQAPWPVKKGGWWLSVYKNSLSLAFGILFLISFSLHCTASYRTYVREESLEGKIPDKFADLMLDSRVWFESFQNWQSEFIAVLSIVLLSIHLRQFGSPESKPVDAPNDQAGK